MKIETDWDGVGASYYQCSNAGAGAGAADAYGEALSASLIDPFRAPAPSKLALPREITQDENRLRSARGG